MSIKTSGNFVNLERFKGIKDALFFQNEEWNFLSKRVIYSRVLNVEVPVRKLFCKKREY